MKTSLALCAAVICVPALNAAGATTFTVPIVNATFNPSTCSALTPTQVTLNGAYHVTVHVSKNPDGTYTIKFQSEAHGTATDNKGGQYVFSYINHEQDISPTANDTFPLLITVTDRFGLSSKGSAPNLKVSFQLALSIDSNGNVTFLGGVAKGDPNCDPI